MPEAEHAIARQTTWLSKGFEELAPRLAAEVDPARRDVDFDFVVIGSGYGGAVAAAALSAQHGAQVCVLERGAEYLPGAFPTRLAEVPRHVRFTTHDQGPRGTRTGLFDFRLSDDVAALVSNGLGGGSLINAGVMEKPTANVFSNGAWPSGIGAASLEPWFIEASQLLGATVRGARNEWRDDVLSKLVVMKTLDGATTKPALTVSMNGGPNLAGVELSPCVSCGDCATGCNYGAKESLDTNLLYLAWKNGAQIFTGATVYRLAKRDDKAWAIYLNHTDDKLRRRQGAPLVLLARQVILAAGTFGTTEILLRSQSDALRFSKKLGERFSTNGDSLASMVELKQAAKAVSDEREAPSSREVGPTITGMVDRRSGTLDESIVIQDLTVPGPLRRLFQETAAIAAGFDDLARGDPQPHSTTDADPCAIDDRETEKSIVVAVLGHDTASGRIELQRELGDENGACRVSWPEARDDKRLAARHKVIEKLLESSPLGGRTLANPLWRVLPEKLEFLFEGARGPVLTVHPLGGCPMAADVQTGVVDEYGRVFAPTAPRDPSQFHANLFVLDGSIVPSSLGINPALTITALALRAVQQNFGLKIPLPNAPPPTTRRPVFRILDPARRPPAARPTKVEVFERAYAEVKVPGHPGPAYAEVTLQFEPTELRSLMDRDPSSRKLELAKKGNELRLFTAEKWAHARQRSDEEPGDDDAFFVAGIEQGTLQIFHRERSQACDRKKRALFAWAFNRGARDSWQELVSRWKCQPEPNVPDLQGTRWIVDRIESLGKLASFAGEVRLFEYGLTVGESRGPERASPVPKGSKLIIRKRLTYDRRANPWNQMMQATLESSALRSPHRCKPADMKLDLRFLERRGVPLFRVVEQEDQVTALVDVAAWMLYLFRIMLRVHTWSFRKPDDRSLDAPQPDRFPRAPRGMAIRQVDLLRARRAIGAPPEEPEAFVRLTRFETKRCGHAHPVLMNRHYSVSGSTFAHPHAPSLAKHLWKRGFDPWVIDLRTSAALPSARYPWSFEQAAYADIPLAVDHILRKTERQKLSIVAHCMGSAMTCMALLGDLDNEQDAHAAPLRYVPPDPYPELRLKLRERISALVLSQVTPYTLYTPANVFRAFVLRYLLEYLNTDNYQFRIDGKLSVTDQLLDRFLTTLPYPKEEFDYENPPYRFWAKTPWTSTRHRMDALYGRDFSVRNVERKTLDYIDDLFGPLSMRTVSQGIHFARQRVITDRTGISQYLTTDRALRLKDIPILSLHGDENGLIDVATQSYVDAIFNSDVVPGLRWTSRRLRGFGHQDTFIGKHAARDVFPVIAKFLEQEVK